MQKLPTFSFVFRTSARTTIPLGWRGIRIRAAAAMPALQAQFARLCRPSTDVGRTSVRAGLKSRTSIFSYPTSGTEVPRALIKNPPHKSVNTDSFRHSYSEDHRVMHDHSAGWLYTGTANRCRRFSMCGMAVPFLFERGNEPIHVHAVKGDASIGSIRTASTSRRILNTTARCV